MFPIIAYRNCQPDDIHCGVINTTPSKYGSLADLCVPKEKKCDGYLDCRSGRDEDGCNGAKCRLDQFRCVNGQKCIESILKCNHKNDCDDGSDEMGCSKYCFDYHIRTIQQIIDSVFQLRFPTLSWRPIQMSKCVVHSSNFPLRWLS